MRLGQKPIKYASKEVIYSLLFQILDLGMIKKTHFFHGNKPFTQKRYSKLFEIQNIPQQFVSLKIKSIVDCLKYSNNKLSNTILKMTLIKNILYYFWTFLI